MSEFLRDADEELNKLFEKIIDESLEGDKVIEWPKSFLIFTDAHACDPFVLIENAIELGLGTGYQSVYRLHAGETHAYAAAISYKHLRETLKTIWENI